MHNDYYDGVAGCFGLICLSDCHGNFGCCCVQRMIWAKQNTGKSIGLLVCLI
jgi:hypothetical protein